MTIASIVTQMGEALRQVTVDGETLRVFTAAETGANGIPEALNQFPCAIVFPGQTLSYRLMQQEEHHDFEVHVQLIESAGFLSDRTAAALPLLDAVLATMSGELGLVDDTGTRQATLCSFLRCTGLVELEYSDVFYAGYDCVFKVISRRSLTPSLGG